ncbi:hypothetical protein H4219_005080 [Mycoemilia scoparia]|uniref:Uncharacterized protein n=1 Tax=Mycoemilia scoparia TaxID=417184 RepID=A0A9W7ZXJ2_9FUNG|nr:hypothetical protein H4219_005080 [Mycoemilia scoparia]
MNISNQPQSYQNHSDQHQQQLDQSPTEIVGFLIDGEIRTPVQRCDFAGLGQLKGIFHPIETPFPNLYANTDVDSDNDSTAGNFGGSNADVEDNCITPDDGGKVVKYQPTPSEFFLSIVCDDNERKAFLDLGFPFSVTSTPQKFAGSIQNGGTSGKAKYIRDFGIDIPEPQFPSSFEDDSKMEQIISGLGYFSICKKDKSRVDKK